MLSHCYVLFYLCAIALFVTHVSARAAPECTPIDQLVSCVYPLSGQYGLLPRLLFYLSIILIVTLRRSSWLVIGILASAMTFAATAFVHIIIIFATRRGHPPILDLDVIVIYLMAKVSVSMYPSLIVFQSGRENVVGKILLGLWVFIMLLTSLVATHILSNGSGGSWRSSTEVACLLPDKSLLTSLGQIKGGPSLECTYDCFLNGGSVLKPQSAATVVGSAFFHDRIGEWGKKLCDGLCGTMIVLGAALPTLKSKKWFPNRLQKAIDQYPTSLESDERLYAIMMPIVWICLISIAPWLIMIEYSIRNIPIEENFSAVGQWAPWATGAFGAIGTFLFRHGNPAYDKENKKSSEPAINGTAPDPSDDDQGLLVTAEDAENIGTEILRGPTESEGRLMFKISNDLTSTASQRYTPKTHTTTGRHGSLRRVVSAPTGGDAADVLKRQISAPTEPQEWRDKWLPPDTTRGLTIKLCSTESINTIMRTHDEKADLAASWGTNPNLLIKTPIG